MNGEKNGAEEEGKPFEVDSEFLLRLPPTPASALRAALKEESKNLKDRLKIQIDPFTMRHAVVKFEDWTLPARVYDLPSIIESYKTLDRKVFYKVADICQIMICDEDQSPEEDESSKNAKLDKDGRDKRYLFPHGVTPCLKNCRKRRFRKTLRKKVGEAPSVENEVKMLLKTDAEAISSRFEIVEDEKVTKKSNGGAETAEDNTKEETQNMPQNMAEYIFGNVSSSSEESDDEATDVGVYAGDRSHAFEVSSSKMEDVECERELLRQLSAVTEVTDEEESRREDSISEHESKLAEEHILNGRKGEEEKAELQERLSELAQAISSLQSQRRRLEVDILSIENQALKERYQINIGQMKHDEMLKQEEYDKVASMLEYE